MNRTAFRRMGADPRRTSSPDENKRGFKSKNTISEDIQGTQKPESENKYYPGRIITNAAKKVLRWAYLSVPAIILPACSVANNEKINTHHMAFATLVGITALLLTTIGSIKAVQGIQKLVNHIKNKKENKIESA